MQAEAGTLYTVTKKVAKREEVLRFDFINIHFTKFLHNAELNVL